MIEKGRRPSEILVLTLRLRPRNLSRRQVIDKVHVLYRTWNFSRTCSHVIENWSYSRVREQELKAQCYILCRESVVAHPRISKINLLILAEKD